MMSEINKSSFNEMDIISYNGIKISGTKKRVHFSWNLDEFFKSYNE